MTLDTPRALSKSSGASKRGKRLKVHLKAMKKSFEKKICLQKFLRNLKTKLTLLAYFTSYFISLPFSFTFSSFLSFSSFLLLSYFLSFLFISFLDFFGFLSFRIGIFAAAPGGARPGGRCRGPQR